MRADGSSLFGRKVYPLGQWTTGRHGAYVTRRPDAWPYAQLGELFAVRVRGLQHVSDFTHQANARGVYPVRIIAKGSPEFVRLTRR